MSRTKETFVDLKNITIIYQFLYMNPEHRIQFKNVINVPIEIRMTDDCKIFAKNLNFPDFEETLYQIDVPNLLALIEQLKQTPAIEYPSTFSNRWNEIKTITSTTISI